MSWARFDDRCSEHPKILSLTDREFRVHFNAILYAARHRDPHIHRHVLPALRATPKIADRLTQAGVWDLNGDGWVIHDWDDYQPGSTSADRMRRKRKRDEGGTDSDTT